jgi:hypothetical protein
MCGSQMPTTPMIAPPRLALAMGCNLSWSKTSSLLYSVRMNTRATRPAMMPSPA